MERYCLMFTTEPGFCIRRAFTAWSTSTMPSVLQQSMALLSAQNNPQRLTVSLPGWGHRAEVNTQCNSPHTHTYTYSSDAEKFGWGGRGEILSCVKKSVANQRSQRKKMTTSLKQNNLWRPMQCACMYLITISCTSELEPCAKVNSREGTSLWSPSPHSFAIVQQYLVSYTPWTTIGLFPVFLCTAPTCSISSRRARGSVHSPSSLQAFSWNWVTLCWWWGW